MPRFLLLFFAASCLHAGPFDTLWTMTAGADGHDKIYDLAQDTGGFIVGTGISDNPDQYDVYLIKVNRGGNTVFERRFDESNGSSDYGYSIAVDGNGNYIVAGYTDAYGTRDLLVIKVEPDSGNIIWKRTYGWGESDYARAVAVAPDGNYLIAGYTYSFNDNTADILLLKVDSADGDILWSRVLESPSMHYKATSMVLDPSGNIFIGGYLNNDDYSMVDGFILKLSPSGDSLWGLEWGGTGTDIVWDLILDSGGNVVVAGYTDSYSPYFDAWILKVDTAYGNLLMESLAGGAGDDGTYSIFEADGRYILAGHTTSYGARNSAALMLEVDTSSGEILDSAMVDWPRSEAIYSSMHLDDGTFIFGGYTSSGDSYPADALLIRTRGTALTGKGEASANITVSPEHGGIMVKSRRRIRIRIISPDGRRIMEIPVMGKRFIDLSPGLYIIRTDGGQSIKVPVR